MRARFLKFLAVLSQPAVAIGGALVIAAVIVGGTWYIVSVSPSGAYTPVVSAPIQQEVDASGPVQGAQTTDLSFQISGQVAAIPAVVGEHVAAGQTLVTLEGGSQAAALAGAQAALQEAQANLAALNAGTRPEQLTIDQSAVTDDQAALIDAIRSGYVAADTAVHSDADQLFTNPRNASAALTVIVPDSILADQVVQERIALEPVLASWSTDAMNTQGSSADAAEATQDLTQVNTFLDDLAAALTMVQPSASVSASALSAYEASIAGARTGIAGALTALTGSESALTGAQGSLALAQAGATPQAIAAGQAQVAAAQAQVAAAQVTSGETVLVAPINGVITAQNANPGESVSPGVPLVSMEGDSAFEAKVPVSESDIGKIKVGQVVNTTFDAYPGVTFPATVTAVDPAATVTDGVSSYQVTATFAANDPRIQSGLTAHLSILTANVPSALIVPASAVIQNGASQFVYVKNPGGKDIETPVTTGIESASGMIQILSGLTAGQQVLTFGTAE